MFKKICWKLGKEAWEITDDDFIEMSFNHRSFSAIIEVYEKRKLNVAANLVLYFKSLVMTAWPISQQIENFARIEKELYLKYKEDIDKYILLI